MGVPLRTLADLRDLLAGAGASPVHAGGVVRAWLAGDDVSRGSASKGARRPRRLERALPGIARALDGLVREVLRSEGEDGARRRVLRLRSGRTVESVDLPRAGVCVSSQVGCAVGCTFCKTGENGLQEQLAPLEILAQVVRARRERDVRRVVFMGMGEPSHNAAAVVEAVRVLGVEGGVAHDRIVVSTVGDPGSMPGLADGPVRPAVALSLHTLDPGLRRSLLPRAPRIDPAVLLARALDHAERTGHPLQVQWVLLEGINDGIEGARELGALLRGRRAMVNYIPYNPLEGGGFRRPPVERCVGLVRAVRAAGGIATLRFSAGQGIEAGCGQLRARASDGI